MGDTLLNGRAATVSELTADGRRCEYERDLKLLAGLLAEYPREAVPAGTSTVLLPPLGLP